MSGKILGKTQEELYVNLTDAQETALDCLEDAIQLCIDAGVQPADIMDTVKSLIKGGEK